MIESITPGASAKAARVVLFDFDGTLSLIRSGWMDVMVPMMTEILASLKTGETEEQLRAVIEGFVWKLTGKETVYQMMAFAEEVKSRGGQPLAPLAYKQMYLDRLWDVIKDRVEALRSGSVSPDQYLVPGSRSLLESLKARGLKLYLASGTDDVFVKEEAELLDVTRYFDGGVHGALDDLNSFSKAILIKKLLDTAEFSGHEFLAFGDGYVEIEEVKKVGGTTVGVASKEPECEVIDDWKRQRLIGVGADYIIPNFTSHEQLLTTLFE